MIRPRIAAALRRLADRIDVPRTAPDVWPTFADVCDAYRTLQLAEAYPFGEPKPKLAVVVTFPKGKP